MPIQRLKRRADFQRLTRARRSFAARGLVLQADRMPDEIGASLDVPLRVGFTASRKVGNAVSRNRAKRRLRALAEELLPESAVARHDYVLIARQGTVDRPFDRLRGDLRYALKKLDCIAISSDWLATPRQGDGRDGAMNDNKNMILAIVLSCIVLFGWQYWELQKAPPPIHQTQEQAQQQGVDAGVPQAPAAGQAPQLPAELNLTEMSRGAALEQAPRVQIETPRLSGTLNLRGARLDDLTLKGFFESQEDDSPLVDLLHPSGGANPYFIEFGWSPAEDGSTGPSAETIWTADRSTLGVDSPVTLSWTNDQDITFEIHLAVDENYLFTVTQRVINKGGAPVSYAPYGRILRTGTPDVLGFYILHEGLIGIFNSVLEEVDYDDLRDERTGRMAYATTGGWMGITDKYWLTALVPDQTAQVQSHFSTRGPEGGEIYQVDYIYSAGATTAGSSSEQQSRFFAGAKETLLLDHYRDVEGIEKFDDAVDWGWFWYLTKPIFYALHEFHDVLGNFGLAILALTVVIKLAFFPLANKSYKSMSKMKLLQPKVMDPRERYGDDKQKMNQEMMALYKNEKVNPLSGCWPVLIQIPVFFALYKVLFNTIEMRHAPFFGWITDLSAKDPTGFLNAFGLVPWSVPPILDLVNIGIWPILMGVTMWAQQKLNPPPADPVQQKIFTWMPFFFTFLLATFPAGLVIYWTWNNALSMLQQYVIMRRMGVAIGGGKAEAKS